MHSFLVKVVNRSYIHVMRIRKLLIFTLNWIILCIRFITVLYSRSYLVGGDGRCSKSLHPKEVDDTRLTQ